MTTLNSAPTAASAAPSGLGAGAVVPLLPNAGAPSPVPLALPGSRDEQKDVKAPPLHLLGSAPAAAPGADPHPAVRVPLDQFAKQGGPDASIKTDAGMVSVHAIFQLDAKTHALTVMLVGQDGQLIRMIPSESVSRMIAAMAAYRGR